VPATGSVTGCGVCGSRLLRRSSTWAPYKTTSKWKQRSSTASNSTDAEPCIDLLWTLTGRLRDWTLGQTATD
jgi:hypothetical protein